MMRLELYRVLFGAFTNKIVKRVQLCHVFCLFTRKQSVIRPTDFHIAVYSVFDFSPHSSFGKNRKKMTNALYETYVLLCTHLKRNSLNIGGSVNDFFGRKFRRRNTCSVSIALYLNAALLELISKNGTNSTN
jgi:hypothetical protein